MKFDYCINCTRPPMPLTRDTFESLINQKWLENLCAEIASGNLERKRDLPAACWQAAFNGQKRANENATPSGLFALDVDHVARPDVLYKTFDDRLSELGIYVVHKTPSAHGLRVVARCRPEFETIAENQAWLAKEICVEHDACTRDLARLSFLVPESYFYYYDPAVFEDLPVATPDPENSAHAGGTRTDGQSAEASEPDKDLKFRNVLYSDIVDKLIARTGGEPAQGERNNRLYLICRLLSNITDRQPDLLFKICPRFGLSDPEVRACCESACKSARAEKLPYLLFRTLSDMGIQPNSHFNYDEEETTAAAFPLPDMPQSSSLPPVIREFVDCAPEDFKVAAAMSCLPVLGFLGSRLRACYLDGEMQAPSFIVNIIAPAASGKGSLLRIPNFCLRKVRESDDAGRETEAEYHKQCLLQKNGAKQPVDPKPIIREVPARISVAMLLKRMQQAQGLHLISVSPEADTLSNSNKQGAWAQKGDIYRVAQDADGGRYGQDYKSESSFSATCPMRYNLLTLGTPGSFARLYPNYEDGLITRCIMVELPSQFGKEMPVWRDLSVKDCNIVLDRLIALMSICQDENGAVLPEYTLKLDWLNESMQQWIKQQQIKAVRDEDHARDQFMRRSALIGFRAGMVAAFLWGKSLHKHHRQKVCEFAKWVAEVVLTTLLNRYSDKVNEQAQQYELPQVRSYKSLFDAVPDVFTREELQRAALRIGNKSLIKHIIYRWKTNGLIEEQVDKYIKIIN